MENHHLFQTYVTKQFGSLQDNFGGVFVLEEQVSLKHGMGKVRAAQVAVEQGERVAYESLAMSFQT